MSAVLGQERSPTSDVDEVGGSQYTLGTLDAGEAFSRPISFISVVLELIPQPFSRL